MKEMTRRTFGILALVALSGCQRSRGTTTTSIGTIKLFNERPTEETFHILVEHDGDVVFWETFQARGSDEQSIHVVDIDQELPQDLAGALKIHARVDEQWDSSVIDGGCSYVGIWAESTGGRDATDEPPVAIRVDTDTNCS